MVDMDMMVLWMVDMDMMVTIDEKTYWSLKHSSKFSKSRPTNDSQCWSMTPCLRFYLRIITITITITITQSCKNVPTVPTGWC